MPPRFVPSVPSVPSPPVLATRRRFSCGCSAHTWEESWAKRTKQRSASMVTGRSAPAKSRPLLPFPPSLSASVRAWTPSPQLCRKMRRSSSSRRSSTRSTAPRSFARGWVSSAPSVLASPIPPLAPLSAASSTARSARSARGRSAANAKVSCVVRCARRTPRWAARMRAKGSSSAVTEARALSSRRYRPRSATPRTLLVAQGTRRS
mmetsp:Transcript_49971/g.130148  ORF Transcript_49971/g.130148 Transcript_49971/m.130148 type:complete len:206 (-) Transcript_49971:675-1292(-)